MARFLDMMFPATESTVHSGKIEVVVTERTFQPTNKVIKSQESPAKLDERIIVCCQGLRVHPPQTNLFVGNIRAQAYDLRLVSLAGSLEANKASANQLPDSPSSVMQIHIGLSAARFLSINDTNKSLMCAQISLPLLEGCQVEQANCEHQDKQQEKLAKAPSMARLFFFWQPIFGAFFVLSILVNIYIRCVLAILFNIYQY